MCEETSSDTRLEGKGALLEHRVGQLSTEAPMAMLEEMLASALTDV